MSASSPTSPSQHQNDTPRITHLLNPKNFHPIPPYNPPYPFPLHPPSQELANDLQALFRERFYIHAAELARTQLLALSKPKHNSAVNTSQQSAPALPAAPAVADPEIVFQLWTARLKALVLGKMGSVAHEEARVLGDLSSDAYRLQSTGESIVPWDLRILAVSLQGTGDVSRYYVLAREARAEISALRALKQRSAADNEELKKWEDRLCELGLFTAAMLMSSRDTKSALELLRSMYTDSLKLTSEVDTDKEKVSTKVAFAIALVYLQIGDTISSRLWFKKLDDSVLCDLGLSVCAIADSDWSLAETVLQKINCSDDDANPDYNLSIQNSLAVSQVYRGKVDEVS